MQTRHKISVATKLQLKIRLAYPVFALHKCFVKWSLLFRAKQKINNKIQTCLSILIVNSRLKETVHRKAELKISFEYTLRNTKVINVLVGQSSTSSKTSSVFRKRCKRTYQEHFTSLQIRSDCAAGKSSVLASLM